MSALIRLARLLHLAGPAPAPSPVRAQRKIDLDYVEYLESVASPELAAFTRKAYEHDLAQAAKIWRRANRQSANASGGRP